MPLFQWICIQSAYWAPVWCGIAAYLAPVWCRIAAYLAPYLAEIELLLGMVQSSSDTTVGGGKFRINWREIIDCVSLLKAHLWRGSLKGFSPAGHWPQSEGRPLHVFRTRHWSQLQSEGRPLNLTVLGSCQVSYLKHNCVPQCQECTQPSIIPLRTIKFLQKWIQGQGVPDTLFMLESWKSALTKDLHIMANYVVNNDHMF